jgi:hypothetical protein
MTKRIKLNVTDGSSTFKILWITEENNSRHPGISNGFFGVLGNTHYTYHDNGLTHTVVSLPGSKKQVMNEVMKIPIDDIKECLQVHFQAIPLNSSNMKLMSSPENHNRVYDKTLTLNVNDFQHGLNIDTTLLRKNSEAVFLDTVKNVFLDTFDLVGIEFIDLEYHPNHRIVITILATKHE